ncbi:MAG: helix-turn-helix transcriptional regulator [Tetrasphaera sp.]|nr:helix-turn-helix transcriptional regulator [Tetrasphaera sp.]
MRARNAGLTDRELQVIHLIGLTLPNADIAEQLGVSINSVKSYIRSATGAWGSTRARQPSSGPRVRPPEDQRLGELSRVPRRRLHRRRVGRTTVDCLTLPLTFLRPPSRIALWITSEPPPAAPSVEVSGRQGAVHQRRRTHDRAVPGRHRSHPGRVGRHHPHRR